MEFCLVDTFQYGLFMKLETYMPDTQDYVL